LLSACTAATKQLADRDDASPHSDASGDAGLGCDVSGRSCLDASLPDATLTTDDLRRIADAYCHLMVRCASATNGGISIPSCVDSETGSISAYLASL
jgi:hypothetical protein